MIDVMGRALLGPWVFAMSDITREVSISAGRLVVVVGVLAGEGVERKERGRKKQ